MLDLACQKLSQKDLEGKWRIFLIKNIGQQDNLLMNICISYKEISKIYPLTDDDLFYLLDRSNVIFKKIIKLIFYICLIKKRSS